MGQNTKVVQEAYDAFGRGDIAGLLALVDDSVEWSSPKTLPHGGDFRGPAGVGKFFEGIGANWSSLVVDVEGVGELGSGTVVGVVRADGTRTEGGADGYGAVHVFTVGDGKITRFREYTDLDSAFA